MPKKKTTIEDLAAIVKQNSTDIEDMARMTQNGFTEMAKNMADGFDSMKVYVDKRFDEMDKKDKDNFYRIHADILQVKEKIAEIVIKLDDVRIRTLEDDNAISTEIIKLENEINWIKDDIKRIKIRQKMKA